MRRRKLTPNQEAKSRAWKEKMRRDNPKRFEGKVVGHTPDAAAGGPPAGGRAIALDSSVNSSVGGQVAAKRGSYNKVEVIRE
jgi:hypothetical protein